MNLGEACRTIYGVHKERMREEVTLILDNEDENLLIEEDQNRIMQVITNFITKPVSEKALKKALSKFSM